MLSQGPLSRNTQRLLLFDLDGTLLLSSGAGRRAMERAGQRVFGAEFTLAGISIAGGLDPLIVEQALVGMGSMLNEQGHAEFRVTYTEELTVELQTAHTYALPGVAALLGQLARRPDVLVGLLTGNYRETGRLKLVRAGIDPDAFSPAIWGDQAATRPGLVKLALDGPSSLDPRRVIVIGDTPHDVNCAKVNDCRSVAVGTGSFSLQELSDAGADLTLADLSAPEPLLRLIDA